MTVYTAIFGTYDELKEPLVITPGWKYICFTDQDFASEIWDVRKVPVLPNIGNQRSARYYKIMFHEHIDDIYSLWIDGSFTINCNLDEWWKRYRAPFTCISHPMRRCVYKEAAACIKNNRGNKIDIEKQNLRYKKLKMPENKGLIASGILMRERTPDVIQFCESWWQELQEQSTRDQLSFAYVAWKMPDLHHLTTWDYRSGQEFIYKKHIPNRK